MTDKELRKLTRKELLEMLVEQGKENERLKHSLKLAREKAEKTDIIINESGTIAEAAVALSGVFEAADKAAKIYLENIKRMSADKTDGQEVSPDADVPDVPPDSVTVESSESVSLETKLILDQASAEADRIVEEAKNKASEILSEADIERNRKLQSANTYRMNLETSLYDLCKKYPGLKEDVGALFNAKQ